MSHIWKPEYQKLDGLFSLGSVSIHIANIQIILATAQQKAKTTAANTLSKQKATHFSVPHGPAEQPNFI